MQITLNAPFAPAGDQPKAIATLTEGLARGEKHQVLLGITGSGKTMTIAHVIANSQRPTLVLAHNKTLAAQLFGELKNLFPQNCVEYFVSYFDYYQPEAYVPSSDTYIEKDSLINERIDKLRHAATRALLERDDVMVVASVSCIYGIGAPEAYEQHAAALRERPAGRAATPCCVPARRDSVRAATTWTSHRGTFRARGDVIEIFPASTRRSGPSAWSGSGTSWRPSGQVDPLRGRALRDLQKIRMFPASHYVTTEDRRIKAIRTIEEELQLRD
jgi:excinuclease ABC subunit B